MTAQPLFQFGTVTLNPTPDRRVIHLQTAFGENSKAASLKAAP
jgi:hypothetical protein